MSELSERFSVAIGKMGRLEKDKRNEHSRYDYLSEEAVKAAVSKAVAEHNLAPSRITFEVIADEWRSAKQGEANIVKVRAVLCWGEDRVEGLGCGIDYGDKAILKAQTAAIREAWKNRFIIATGHDPEADEETDSDGPTKGAPHPTVSTVVEEIEACGTVKAVDVVAGSYRSFEWSKADSGRIRAAIAKRKGELENMGEAA